MKIQDKTEASVQLDLKITKEDIIERYVQNHYNDLKKTAAAYKRTTYKEFSDELTKKVKDWNEKYDAFINSFEKDLVDRVVELSGIHEVERHVIAGGHADRAIYLHIRRYEGGLIYLEHTDDGIIESLLSTDSKMPVCYLVNQKGWHGVISALILRLSLKNNKEFKTLIRELKEIYDFAKSFEKTSGFRKFEAMLSNILTYSSRHSNNRDFNNEYWENYKATIKTQIIDKLSSKILEESFGILALETMKVPELAVLPETCDVDEELGLTDYESDDEDE